MKSMTGFGRGEAAGENFSIAVELKTVNNRFLDTNIRLPNELQAFENTIKSKITERLSRGRIEVNVQYERTTPVTYELNRPLISGYIAAMREVSAEFEMKGEPDLNLIARLPNALLPKKADFDEPFIDGLGSALDSALDLLEEMREVEGNNLKDDLAASLSEIVNAIPVVESETETVSNEYFERLEKKISKLLAKSDTQIEIDQSRLAQEVAYIADKSDIAEEISRLKSHIDQFNSIIESSGSIGKKLDFLTQELNREANTIASKTQNLTIKEAALGMKASIEKIREQVQNVE